MTPDQQFFELTSAILAGDNETMEKYIRQVKPTFDINYVPRGKVPYLKLAIGLKNFVIAYCLVIRGADVYIKCPGYPSAKYWIEAIAGDDKNAPQLVEKMVQLGLREANIGEFLEDCIELSKIFGLEFLIRKNLVDLNAVLPYSKMTPLAYAEKCSTFEIINMLKSIE